MNYCLAKEEQFKENDSFRYTPCGELVVWMAEISNAFNNEALEALVDKIILSGEIKNRRKWNAEIKSLCWDKIVSKIENTI